jgi:prephenate dehydrogenase
MSARGSAEPALADLGIVGLGLIGGSVALAARAAWPRLRITGVDRPDVLDAARRGRFIDEGRATIGELAECDLIVLATPVPAILELIADAGRGHLRGVVTDVGSTKREIMAAAARAQLPAFVGGHPVAGAELGGLSQARGDLFLDRPWMIVAGNEPDARALSLVNRLATGLGAVPHAVDAVEHDRTMAYISHVPQLVAVALMSAAGEACGDAGLGVAGRAFREMTRLASSPHDLWRGILATNADFIAEALAAFERKLPPGAALSSGSIDSAFAEAQKWRARLPQTPPRLLA